MPKNKASRGRLCFHTRAFEHEVFPNRPLAPASPSPAQKADHHIVVKEDQGLQTPSTRGTRHTLGDPSATGLGDAPQVVKEILRGGQRRVPYMTGKWAATRGPTEARTDAHNPRSSFGHVRLRCVQPVIAKKEQQTH